MSGVIGVSPTAAMVRRMLDRGASAETIVAAVRRASRDDAPSSDGMATCITLTLSGASVNEASGTIGPIYADSANAAPLEPRLSRAARALFKPTRRQKRIKRKRAGR